MKRVLSLLFILLFSAAGCALQAPIEQTPTPPLEQSPYGEVNMLTGVSIETEFHSYPAGTEEVTLIWTNRTMQEYIFGEAFLVEQNINGIWYALPMQEGIAFHDIANVLGPNSTRAQKLALQFAYGALPEGAYRVVMQAIAQSEEETETYPLTAAFTIDSAAPSAGSPQSPIQLPASIPGVAALSVAEVFSIECYGGAQTPYMPSQVWAADADVAAMLAYLQSIRLTGYSGKASPEAQTLCEQYGYILRCFDGRAFNLDFACGALSFGEGYYTYEFPESGVPAQPVSLAMRQYGWPAGAEEVGYSIINETGDTLHVVLAPKLESATGTGWAEVPADGGFCGVADPVGPDGLTSALPFAAIYPTAGEGFFRLSFTVYDQTNKEYSISTVFTAGEAE